MLSFPFLNYWKAPFYCLCLVCLVIEDLIMNRAAWPARHHGFHMFVVASCKALWTHQLWEPSDAAWPPTNRILSTSVDCCTRRSNWKRPAFEEGISCWRLLFARVWFGSPMVSKRLSRTQVLRRKIRQSQKIPFCTIGKTPLGSRFVYLNCWWSPRLILISVQSRITNATSVCAPMRQVLYKHASPLAKWGFPCSNAFIS